MDDRYNPHRPDPGKLPLEPFRPIPNNEQHRGKCRPGPIISGRTGKPDPR